MHASVEMGPHTLLLEQSVSHAVETHTHSMYSVVLDASRGERERKRETFRM